MTEHGLEEIEGRLNADDDIWSSPNSYREDVRSLIAEVRRLRARAKLDAITGFMEYDDEDDDRRDW